MWGYKGLAMKWQNNKYLGAPAPGAPMIPTPVNGGVGLTSSKKVWDKSEYGYKASGFSPDDHGSFLSSQGCGPPLQSLGQDPHPALASPSLWWMTTVLCYLGGVDLHMEPAIMCTYWT